MKYVERARELTASITSLDQAKLLAERKKQLEELTVQLGEKGTALALLVKTAKLLSSLHDEGNSDQRTRMAGIVERLREVVTKLQRLQVGNCEVLSSQATTLPSYLSAISEEVSRQCHHLWGLIVDGRLGGVSAFRMVVEKSIPDTPLAQAIAAHLQAVRKMGASPPKTKSDVKAFKDLEAREADLVNKMTAAGFSDAVKSFVHQLTQGTAKLKSLTPEILEFVRRHNLEDHLTIRLQQ